jgi:hypothetical protein
MPHASVLPPGQRKFFYDQEEARSSTSPRPQPTDLSSDKNDEVGNINRDRDPVLEENAYAELMNEYFGPPIGVEDEPNVTSPGPQPEIPRERGDPVDNHWARVDAQARVPLFASSTTSK